MGMFLLFPRKITVETSLTPAQCRARLARELVTYKRKSPLVDASRFLKQHRAEECFFGSCSKDGKTRVFYHRAKRHDGSSAGFYGNISRSPEGKGSVITGSIRRPVAVVIAAAVWTLVLIVLILALLALKEYAGAAVSGVLFLAALGEMAYDRSAKYVREYLEGFAEQTASAE